MICPFCEGRTHVIDSRAEPDLIWRRRECKRCKFRFNTVEVDEDMYIRLERGKKREQNHNSTM